MVLNTKTTQKMGHTTSPSQKIRDSALEVVSFSVCRKKQQQNFTSDRSIKIHVTDNGVWEITGSMPLQFHVKFLPCIWGQYVCAMLHCLQLSCKVMQLHYTNNDWANVTRALQKVLRGVFGLWNLRRTVFSGMQSPVLLWICSHKSFISVTVHRGRVPFNWKEGNVMRPSPLENTSSIQICPFHVRNVLLKSVFLPAGDKHLLFSLTFLDSKTQWLFPSSSIWFHHRSPTNNLPDTFWGQESILCCSWYSGENKVLDTSCICSICIKCYLFFFFFSSTTRMLIWG